MFLISFRVLENLVKLTSDFYFTLDPLSILMTSLSVYVLTDIKEHPITSAPKEICSIR